MTAPWGWPMPHPTSMPLLNTKSKADVPLQQLDLQINSPSSFSVSSPGFKQNVLRGFSQSSIDRYITADTSALQSLEGFIAARSAAAHDQIGDPGSSIWFTSLSSSRDEAALSLIMRKGLPQSWRRKAWLSFSVADRTSPSTFAK